ncbi:MAG: hypothetical protein AAF138_10375 [Planctomycetota bacterium]
MNAGLAARVGVLGVIGSAAIGCTTVWADNPAFPVDRALIDDEWDRLREEEPVALERPVVILGGYRAVPTMAVRLADRLALLTGAPREDFFAVSYTFGSNMSNIVDLATTRVDKRWPSENPDETIEVDVVGISMGGLIGRAAALPAHEAIHDGKRLRVRRLYTLASPHRGALLAEKIAPDKAARAMKPGSEFLSRLDRALAEIDYEITPYAVLNDSWVGATRTAPIGYEPIWTGGRSAFSHFAVPDDRRILVDLARRLRGEPPLAERGTTPPKD